MNSLRHGLRRRGPVHALLADGQGVWAWSPADPHAAATRHASVQEWIKTHPGCDIGLWVSGQLVHSLERNPVSVPQDDEALRSNARRELVDRHGNGAADWALATWKNDVARGVCAHAGIDLGKLNQHAREHGVRMQSVVPRWFHAFQEARRCVDALNHAVNTHVCVVEGRQIAWIVTARVLLAVIAVQRRRARGCSRCTPTARATMRSKPVAAMLVDLDIARSHSRPLRRGRQPVHRGAVQDAEITPGVPRALRLPGRLTGPLSSLLCLVQRRPPPLGHRQHDAPQRPLRPRPCAARDASGNPVPQIH